jgi:hypothetical protein
MKNRKNKEKIFVYDKPYFLFAQITFRFNMIQKKLLILTYEKSLSYLEALKLLAYQ